MKFKKILIIGILFLFLGTCITPSVAVDNVKKPSIPISSGNTLYVGGTGPGNYTKIQDAIDNASDGDTVFVFDESSPYYEKVVVAKRINLIGENRDTTIIDSGGNGDVLYVTPGWVNISGFSIKNSGEIEPSAGIWIDSHYNTISDNNIFDNYYGITIDGNSNTISGNLIINNDDGIHRNNGDYNTIIDNTISNNYMGISLIDVFSWYTFDNKIINNTIINNYYFGISIYGLDNTISGNNITNNSVAISILGGNDNTISDNKIINNNRGILLRGDSNSIYHNNIINNTENAYDEGNNTWDYDKYGNYWSDYKEIYPDAKRLWLKGVWDTPYEIEGGENKDNYPLINQWPKTRTRTSQKTTTTIHPIVYWFLERFPLLERLLSFLLL